MSAVLSPRLSPPPCADAIYGFCVYGMLLAPEFAKYPNVYRSNEAGMAFLPMMFAGIFVAMWWRR